MFHKVPFWGPALFIERVTPGFYFKTAFLWLVTFILRERNTNTFVESVSLTVQVSACAHPQQSQQEVRHQGMFVSLFLDACSSINGEKMSSHKYLSFFHPESTSINHNGGDKRLSVFSFHVVVHILFEEVI